MINYICAVIVLLYASMQFAVFVENYALAQVSWILSNFEIELRSKKLSDIKGTTQN